MKIYAVAIQKWSFQQLPEWDISLRTSAGVFEPWRASIIHLREGMQLQAMNEAAENYLAAAAAQGILKEVIPAEASVPAPDPMTTTEEPSGGAPSLS